MKKEKFSGGVFGEEVLEHPGPVFAGKIAEVEGDAELAANGHRIATVFLGAAMAAAIIGPVLHEQSGDRFAGLDQA